MNRDYLKRLNNYYSSSLSAGEPHKQVKWGNKHSQWKRFEILLEIFHDISNAKILDYGCGTGELCAFLKTYEFSGEYHGYDILQEMLDLAKKKYPAYCFLRSITGIKADFVIASGIFTVSSESEMYEEIHKMYELSLKGISFNSLSSWAPQKDVGEFYADPLKTMEFCKTITPKLVLRHDYMPHDFTIYMYK